MTLATLLEELKEVDAEQSEKLQCWMGRTRQFMNLEVPLECDLAQALIQGCIQRACERRKWGFIICNQVANVYTKASVCASEIYDTPAEALLAAYIAAVKETKR